MFQVNVLSSGIIYKSENIPNFTHRKLEYDTDLSTPDSGNSFENENEKHSNFFNFSVISC